MFRLALQMGCSVRELGERITAAELTEWMGYALIEPFGQGRADDGARGMMAVAAMAAGAKDVTPADFLTVWHPAAPERPDNYQERLAGLVDQLDAIAVPKED